MSFGAKFGIWVFIVGLIGFLLILLGVAISPEKIKYVVASRDVCEKSEIEITATLTVIKAGDETSYDALCARSNTGKYKMYSTKEGIYFDTFRELTAGDQIRVSGRFYHIDDNRIAISGDLIEDISVKRLPLFIPSPTATAIRVQITP